MFNKKEFAEYKILNESELKDNSDIVILESVQDQNIHQVPSRQGGGLKEVVLTKTKFLVGVKRDAYIKKIKKKLKVGVKNYVEFDEMKVFVSKVQKDIIGIEEDFKTKATELRLANAKLLYLKSHLGTDVFNNLLANYENAKKGMTRKKAALNVGEAPANARG